MSNNDEIKKSLESIQENKTSDWGALAARGALGAIPWIGGLLGEVITELIPNQRTDRIVHFLNIFSEKVKEIDEDLLRTKLHDPYHIDIFEDACFQAIRALSDERLNYIANALKNSLTDDQLEITHRKTLLWLLGQINDIEVILLFFYQKSLFGEHREYAEEHKNVLFVPPASMGSTPEEFERETIHNSYKAHLAQLGLLHDRFSFIRKGEIPEFDTKTGKFKGSHIEITPLGRSLCDYITDEIEE